MHRQGEDVLPPLPQGGDDDLDDVKPEVEVVPETPGLHLLLEIPLGGAHDPHVDGEVLVSADPPERPLLDRAQQLALHARRDLAYFVQEQRPPVSGLEKPPLRLDRAGERPPHVPEQLALHQRFGYRRAVDRDERGVLPFAPGVQRGGDQLLPGSALPQDHHVGVGGGDPVDQLVDLEHRLAAADDPLEGGLPLDLLSKGPSPLHGNILGGQRSLDEVAQVLIAERLDDVVVGALLDGFDRPLDRGVGGHHDHLRGRCPLDRRADDLEAVVRRSHPHVREDEIEDVFADGLLGIRKGGGHVHPVSFLLQEDL